MKTATAITLSAAVLAATLQIAAIGAILGNGNLQSPLATAHAGITMELTRESHAPASQVQFSVKGN